MTEIHNFRKSLAVSHSHAGAGWWKQIYQQAFPSMIGMHDVRADGWHQRAGIDRVIILSNTQSIYIDEKVRTSDWPDVLLEVWSDYRRRTPGWVAKDLRTDYIAYAFIPSQTCLLIPFLGLRQAWRANHKDWVKKYDYVDAPNEGYLTRSTPVPTEVLKQAIADTMTIRWQAIIVAA